MFQLVVFVVTIVGAGAQLLLSNERRTVDRVVSVGLLYLLVVGYGVQGIVGFIAHVFFADQIATGIGWPTGSPFQYEIGWANLGYGVAGVLCSRWRGGFWAATGIIASIFYLGAAIGHVDHALAGNTAEYNSGMILFTDFFYPIATMGLLAISWSRARLGAPRSGLLASDARG